MPNQRSKRRNKLLGTYVTDEIYEQVLQRAKDRGVTVSDYLRDLYRESLNRQQSMQRSGDHGRR